MHGLLHSSKLQPNGMKFHRDPCLTKMQQRITWTIWQGQLIWILGMAIVQIIRLHSKTYGAIRFNDRLNNDSIYNMHTSSHRLIAWRYDTPTMHYVEPNSLSCWMAGYLPPGVPKSPPGALGECPWDVTHMLVNDHGMLLKEYRVILGAD